MKNKAHTEVISGMRAIIPLAAGVAAYGLAFGLLASQTGFSWIETGLMGALVFAGSSQIVVVERLAAGVGVAAACVAGIALNLRLVLITASMRNLFAKRPLWQRILGAHLSTDENWALTLVRRSQGQSAGYWFLIGAGAVLVLTWVFSSVFGVVFALRIPNPQAYAIDFAFTAAFIAISRSLWRGYQDAAPWVIAVGVVIIITQLGLFDVSWAIVLGGLAGALTAGMRRDV